MAFQCAAWLAPVLLSLVGDVSGHSHVTNIVVDGKSYGGFNPRVVSKDVLAAWETKVADDGWVGGNDYEDPDIICHVNASNGHAHVAVEAGNTVHFQWNGWPETHHGPVLTYLAYCGQDANSCLMTDKREFEFFEIDAVGLTDPNKTLHQYPTAKGIWGSDLLIHNNSSFVVQIPPTIAPGYYVMRHEVIALHLARSPALGPQHYPQCINVRITGEGRDRPAGVKATELYGDGQEGLVYDIYGKDLPPYPMPGPTLFAGAKPSAAQTRVTITSEATATPGAAKSRT